MDARENSELENLELMRALPVDYAHADLNDFPDDFPLEITQEIMRRAPAKMTLFAQTSSYWHSYFYLQQLQAAAACRFAEKQEQLLTDLIIHSELLIKEDAQKNLPQWIFYLRRYYLNTTLDMKNRLFAQALLLMIDKKSSERQFAEFDYLLKQYCFSFVHKKKELYQSLRFLVMRARGMKCIEPTGLISLLKNQIDSVSEARLIVAPLKLYQGDLESLIENASAIPGEEWLSLIYIIHAMARLLCPVNGFSPEVIKKLVSHIKTQYCMHFVEHEQSQFAYLDLMLFLIRSNPEVANLFDNYSLDDLKPRELDFILYLQQLENFASLSNDINRVEWLRVFSNSAKLECRWLPFAKRVCASLESDEAIEIATCGLVDFYEQEYLASHYDVNERHLIAELIQLLSRKLKSGEARKKIFKMLQERVEHDTVLGFLRIMKAMFVFEEIGDPILEEQYEKLKNNTPIDSKMSDIWDAVTSRKKIDHWLEKFKLLIQSLPANWGIDETYSQDIASIYTQLLVKHGDKDELQKWYPTLERLYRDCKWNELEMLHRMMLVLPVLDKETADPWIVRLKAVMIPRATFYLNGIPIQDGGEVVVSDDFVDDFLLCMTRWFPTISPEAQRKYWEFIKAQLLPSRQQKGFNISDLNALPNLLRQLPDDCIAALDAHALPASPAARRLL